MQLCEIVWNWCFHSERNPPDHIIYQVTLSLLKCLQGLLFQQVLLCCTCWKLSFWLIMVSALSTTANSLINCEGFILFGNIHIVSSETHFMIKCLSRNIWRAPQQFLNRGKHRHCSHSSQSSLDWGLKGWLNHLRGNHLLPHLKLYCHSLVSI